MASDWGSASDINYPPPSAPTNLVRVWCCNTPINSDHVLDCPFRPGPWAEGLARQPAAQQDHDPEALRREDCPACVANGERPLMPIERSNGRQRTCCDTTEAHYHSTMCPHAQQEQRAMLESWVQQAVAEERQEQQRATLGGWVGGGMVVNGRRGGKRTFQETLERFVHTYYAAGQVVEVRMSKNLLEPPVVVQRHDQRAEDATYENEFRMHRD